jgi:hypothetical protein
MCRRGNEQQGCGAVVFVNNGGCRWVELHDVPKHTTSEPFRTRTSHQTPTLSQRRFIGFKHNASLFWSSSLNPCRSARLLHGIHPPPQRICSAFDICHSLCYIAAFVAQLWRWKHALQKTHCMHETTGGWECMAWLALDSRVSTLNSWMFYIAKHVLLVAPCC